MNKRSVPPAQKQGRGEHRDRKHVDVLSQEEQREFHCTVLGMKAGHEFSLGFRKIEGDAVGLGNCGDEIEQKAERLGPDYIPSRYAEMSCLLLDYAVEIERS